MINLKFEYIVISINNYSNLFDINKKLNKYGLEGWELVSIYNGNAYFKREINEIILKS
jgi:hypothetical protein